MNRSSRLFLLVLVAIIYVMGCTSKNAQPNTSNIQIVPDLDIKNTYVQDSGTTITIEPLPAPRTDLPLNWVEVSSDELSYGIPAGFNPVAFDPSKDNIVAEHISQSIKLTVTSRIYESNLEIHQFVLSDFIMTKMTMGAEVLGQREKSIGDITTVAVNMLYSKQNMVQMSSLDFFRKKDNRIFHLQCNAEVSILKMNSDICFQMADTLQLK